MLVVEFARVLPALPDGLKTIGDFAFAGCAALTSVLIPKSVTSIGAGAFTGCTALTAIDYSGTEAEWAQLIPADAREAVPGQRVATPVFDGADEREIAGLLENSLVTRDGDGHGAFRRGAACVDAAVVGALTAEGPGFAVEPQRC